MRASIFASIAYVAALAASASATVYNGNGLSGFGGPIGNGALTVVDNGSNVDFSLTAGTNFSGNVLVLYVDSVAGGNNSSSTFTDTADPGRTAISGLSGNGRTLVTFPSLFGADYAITLEPGIFSGTFGLSNPSNFQFLQGNNLAGSGAGPFTFSVAKTTLGLPTSGAYSFNFVGTLISPTAYRSNETIGLSVTIPGNVGDTPNAGFTGTQTFSTGNNFAVAVPESSAVCVLAALGMAALIIKQRLA